MARTFRSTCLAVTGVSALLAASASAEDLLDLPSFLRVSGFGTLGLATGDNKQYGLLRDQESYKGAGGASPPPWTDSRLGLQIDAEITPDLSATIQGVFQKDPGVSFTQTVQWAFLKYQPASWLQIRVGRMGANSFMLSDLRNVGFTYDWVRPPTEFYGMFPIYSYDGVDATYRARLSDSWSLELQGLYGASRFSVPDNDSKTSDFKFPAFWGGNAVLRDENWTFRLSGLQTHIGNTLPEVAQVESGFRTLAPLVPGAASMADEVGLQGRWIHFYSAGIGYEDGGWNGQTEYGRTECGCTLIRGSNSAYAMLGHHFGEWTPFLSYSRVWPDHAYQPVSSPLPVPQIQRLYAGGNDFLQLGDLDQDDRTVGVRWNFWEKADLKLQYDNYKVRNFSALWRIPADRFAGGRGTVNIFSAAIDFIF